MEVKQVIVVRNDLSMRKGKIAAQVAHAAMKFLVEGYKSGSDTLRTGLNNSEAAWLSGAFAKIVARADSEQELLDLIAKARQCNITVHPITDAGRTEFHGVPTLTCASFGPDEIDRLDAVTGHLKLL